MVVTVVCGGSRWREQSPDINHTFLAAPWPKYQQSIRPRCCVIVVADRLPLPYAAQTGASCFGQRHHLSTKSAILVATACLSCAFPLHHALDRQPTSEPFEHDQRASRHRLLVLRPPLHPPNHRRVGSKAPPKYGLGRGQILFSRSALYLVQKSRQIWSNLEIVI